MKAQPPPDSWSGSRSCTPGLFEGAGRLVVAVNGEYVPMDHVLADGDEVALIPPVSGGWN